MERKLIDVRQNAFAAFFKDDWKMTPRLTWNLGLRYEYYGVPFENKGLGIAPVGGGIALLGVSGRSFDNWLRPGQRRRSEPADDAGVRRSKNRQSRQDPLPRRLE